MPATFLLALALTLGVGGTAPPDAALRELLQRELDAWRVEVGAPGAVAAVARRAGPAVVAASGLARKEPPTPMPPEARMFSGSVGKVLVATVALQLAEERLLDLDAPIADAIGELAWFDRLPNGDSLTARQLLNHTSGLPEYFDQPGAIAKLRAAPQAKWSVEERLAFVFDRPVHFAPGQGWSYADTNYIVLGAAIEAAAGASFYDLARARLIAPLELAQTEAAVTPTLAGLVSGYTTPGRPFPFPAEVAVDGVFCANPQFEWTGGGFITNAGDLARLAAVLWGSDVLLPAARRAEMTTGVAAKLTPGERYGLGCTVRDVRRAIDAKAAGEVAPAPAAGAASAAPDRAIGHSGWFPGYLTDVAWYEQAGLAVALQVNTDQGIGLARQHAFLDRVAAAVAALAARSRGGAASPDLAGDDSRGGESRDGHSLHDPLDR